MERVEVLDTGNGNATGNKLKGEEKVGKGKGAPAENVVRKGLVDISNLPKQNQVERKSQLIPTDSKGHIEKLQRENVELMKLVLERNKIIEMRGIELQKLRINYQMIQQQNLQLAQANTQMLAEINSGKDRLKVLQHELGCKNILLKARKLESKDETIKCENADEYIQRDKVEDKCCNTKRKRQSKSQSFESTNDKPIQGKRKVEKKRQSASLNAGDQETDDSVKGTDASSLAAVKPVQADDKVDKERLQSKRQSARLKSRAQEPTEELLETSDAIDPAMVEGVQADDNRSQSRRQAARLKSQGQEPTKDLSDTSAFGPDTVKGVQADNNRLNSRRQSARYRSQELAQEPTRDLLQVDEATVHPPPLPDTMPESCPTSSISSIKNEAEVAEYALESGAQDHRRSSVRPTRRAAEKVQSYKEIPVNIKMRRES